MKLSTFIMFILVIAGVFFIYAEMVRETNENIEDTPYLNSSEWEDRYNYVEDLNSTFSPLEEKLKTITDEDTGWFSKLTSGITAIPYVLLIVPTAVFDSLVFGGDLIVGSFTALLIPALILNLAIVALIIWAIIELIKFYNKTDF